MSNEIAQMKAQRLMLLGVISEMSQEDQDVIQKARAELTETSKQYGDHGAMALSIVMIEAAIDREG